MPPTGPNPRLLRPEEFEACMTLVNDCFGHESGYLEERMPHCFDEAHPERHAVIVADGEIVSHAACVPGELHASNARVGCNGIAGVATHPDYRGNGYMGRLLEFWLDRIADQGTPLAELEGNRIRYARFGWENAGLESRYRITERSFDRDPERGSVRSYRPLDLDSIRNVHERERYRVSRDRRRYERLLDQTGLETIVHAVDDGKLAYCCYRGEDPASILEFGGDHDGVAALLDYVLETVGDIDIYTHPRHSLVPLFREVAIDWESGPHRKLNVLDLPATIEAYEPLLVERWERAPIDATAGKITLAVDAASNGESGKRSGDGTPVTISYDHDGLRVDRTNRKPDVSLGRCEMVDFLFGPSDVYHPITRSQPILDFLLPLEYYFWQTETV